MLIVYLILGFTCTKYFSLFQLHFSEFINDKSFLIVLRKVLALCLDVFLPYWNGYYAYLQRTRFKIYALLSFSTLYLDERGSARTAESILYWNFQFTLIYGKHSRRYESSRAVGELPHCFVSLFDLENGGTLFSTGIAWDTLFKLDINLQDALYYCMLYFIADWNLWQIELTKRCIGWNRLFRFNSSDFPHEIRFYFQAKYTVSSFHLTCKFPEINSSRGWLCLQKKLILIDCCPKYHSSV